MCGSRSWSVDMDEIKLSNPAKVTSSALLTTVTLQNVRDCETLSSDCAATSPKIYISTDNGASFLAQPLPIQVLPDYLLYFNGLVIDEEQKFGVDQKEYLINKYPNIHLFSLSATPIPRTLQMSLSGVRTMSLITTPPVDRLSIRTFVSTWDNVTLKEAIKREIHRGGLVFCVVPRIKDLNKVHDKLIELLPDLKIATAHGRMLSLIHI